MPRRRSHFFIPSLAATFVGASRASSPVSTSTGNSGTGITLPLPSGVQIGDFAYVWGGADDHSAANPVVDNNSLDLFFMFEDAFVASHTFVSTPPTNFTFTCTLSNRSRGAVMVVVRGGSQVDSAFNTNDTYNLGDLDATSDGSIIVAFAKCRQGTIGITTPTEQFSANSPLILQKQHVCQGTLAFNDGYAVAVAVQTGVTAGTHSGLSLANAGTPETDIMISRHGISAMYSPS